MTRIRSPQPHDPAIHDTVTWALECIQKLKSTPGIKSIRFFVLRFVSGQIDGLAALYGVTVKRLNEQIRRNPKRFPDDFVLHLTEAEWNSLRSHFATLKRGQHRKYLPSAFTEHGAIMAATVLNSQKAIDMSVAVVKAFVRLRRLALSVEALSRKVMALENKYDASFRAVFDAIRDLMEPPTPPRKSIGFSSGKE